MEGIDYEKVIADLEGRRLAFNASVDAAIIAIRAVLAAGTGIGRPHEPVAASAAPNGHLTPEMLFGKSIPEAAMTCLQTFKRPMGSKEIADALDAASYHHRSKNFPNTVNSILNRREENVGDVVRVGRQWGLAEWYPGRRRKAERDKAEDSPMQEAENGGE
jgi:hypothetical protein